MRIDIDGTLIYDVATGKNICDVEEIENMEQAKEIIGILIEEIEKLLTKKKIME